MLARIYTVLFLLTSFSVFGQSNYRGQILDAATLENIPNVTITLINHNLSTQSDFNGEFDFGLGDANEGLLFQMIDNTIIMQEQTKADVMIIGLTGKVHVLKKMNEGSTFSIPVLRPGLYVLRTMIHGKNRGYKIASDGFQSIMVDKSGIKNGVTGSQLNDSLLIEKPGYVTKKIAVERTLKALEIGMVRENYDDVDYFDRLLSRESFEVMSSNPNTSNLGDVKSVKIVFDREANQLYYMNSKKYPLHYTFALLVLGFNQGPDVFNSTQYTYNPNRYLDLASINYYSATDKYVLQFVSATEMSCEDINRLYFRILSTSFIADRLYFFPIKEDWEQCTDLNIISSEELYEGQIYQGLNLASNYGYLRRVASENLPEAFLNRRDIVLTDGVPNDLPVVAGIITSEFQTPLSHINVLSNSRQTPNMALRNAWEDEDLRALDGALIFLEVKSDSYELREAALEEAMTFWEEHEPQEEIILAKNETFQTLVDMTDADITYVDKIGGKAANFAEILNVDGVPTPENAFAIPFFYYEQHMDTYGLNAYLDALYENTEFQSNAVFRSESLAEVRDSIISSPINNELVDMVRSKINHFEDFGAFRFRSSTNAEDLEEFSGAGLYKSHSAKNAHETKTIEAATRKVWASLWNWRAFEERSYFKIRHSSTAMGILVHRSFPDEDANGVLITKNLYNSNPGFIINVQYKEYSIVFPEPGIIHDQIILYDLVVNPENTFTIEYLTFSNVPELNGQRVMSDEELVELGQYAKKVKERFYYDLLHNCDCNYEDFGVDIEFKVDSQVSERKIYIKQARLFK